MKICVYGAGAIGGYLATRLSLAASTANDVTLIARGKSLEAIQKNGLHAISHDQRYTARGLTVTGDAASAGPQDYVFVTTKSHHIMDIVHKLPALFGPHTAIIAAQNGIPWWYNYKLPGQQGSQHLESIDPGAVQWNTIGPERVIGGVVFLAAERSEPGVIMHHSGNKLTLGEPDGSMSERVLKLSEILIDAGFQAPVRDNIRDEIWKKLWGNLCVNPISALTLGSMGAIASDPATREVCRNMMLEAQTIGEKSGIHFRLDVDTRLDEIAKVGAHKTSMLQDLLAGRTLEIDALLAVIQEMGRNMDIHTPVIDTVLALVQQRAGMDGLYPVTGRTPAL